jgi:hypothetical protein
MCGLRQILGSWDTSARKSSETSGAITDIKSLEREDNRFLQMMHVRLNSHRKNLDTNKMGHHITSEEMVNKHWVPLLTDRAKEDWIKAPLWTHFNRLMERQAEACR